MPITYLLVHAPPSDDGIQGMQVYPGTNSDGDLNAGMNVTTSTRNQEGKLKLREDARDGRP